MAGIRFEANSQRTEWMPQTGSKRRATGGSTMRRRDLLRGAALASAGVALSPPGSFGEPETAPGGRVGKIAMEEHFMVPEFMEYFAETYPNINADIAKLAPGALMD